MNKVFISLAGLALALCAGTALALHPEATLNGPCMTGAKGERSQCWEINDGNNVQCANRPGQQVVEGKLKSCGQPAAAAEPSCAPVVAQAWGSPIPNCNVGKAATKPAKPGDPVQVFEDRTRPHTGKRHLHCVKQPDGSVKVEDAAPATCVK